MVDPAPLPHHTPGEIRPPPGPRPATPRAERSPDHDRPRQRRPRRGRPRHRRGPEPEGVNTTPAPDRARLNALIQRKHPRAPADVTAPIPERTGQGETMPTFGHSLPPRWSPTVSQRTASFRPTRTPTTGPSRGSLSRPGRSHRSSTGSSRWARLPAPSATPEQEHASRGSLSSPYEPTASL